MPDRPALFRLVLLACLATSTSACGDDRAAGNGCPDGFRLVGDECVPSGRPDGGGGDGGGDTGETDAGGDAAADVGTDTSDETCRELATRCRDELTPQVCAEGDWVDQAACGESDACQNGRCVPRQACTPGEVAGCSDAASQRVCNDDGDLFVARACGGGLFCFRGECGTQICEPDRLRCVLENDLDIETCATDGESWEPAGSCDFDAEEVCFEGECVSGCLASVKDPTYIGCEYWSVDLPQYQDPATPRDPREIPHSVVLANTTSEPADITVDTMSGVTVTPSTFTLPGGGVTTINFPRNDVEGTVLNQRSFRIQATQPIVAYQFNPLNDANVFSNDASLLLPASAIGVEYYVLSWPGGVAIPGVGPQTGWFTVVAASPGVTNVEITFASDVVSGTPPPLQGITRGTTRSFPITQWSVLSFECETTFSFPPRVNDLTGSHIVADQPIVVFAGHEEAVIGEGTPDDETGGTNGPCCADHLEEQLLPVRTWRTRYLAVHSPPRGTEDDVWRVIASQPGTTITTTPPIADLDGVTLNSGEWVEASTNQSFEINASAPIMVAQYLVSQTALGVEEIRGDPAMILAVPVEQYRDEYALLTPSGYARDYVTVVRPVGSTVDLDGSPINAGQFTPFGTNDFEYAHIQWSPGAHALSGDAPFGVVMTGYDSAVSYGYPGGLDLNPRRE